MNAPAPSQRRSRRLILLSLAAVLVLLLLALTPPLINVGRLRLRIAGSMSTSLGRPVHLDRVQMHLLPLPGFTLDNLVVSEDPRFGSEPVIRANVVEATLRPSSLWRRQVEFSTIHFVEPSLNLVREPGGQWNIQSLLMNAARLQAAPTAQLRPGTAPRFPYIEATGARINIKSGSEKKPYSLTDTDFALWLPSPGEWNLRLEGHPSRTDRNVSDAGVMRLEGSLQRSSTVSDVPVQLHASWHDAPLGEASRLLTGRDAGWRGTLSLDADATGTLGHTTLATTIHLNELRRTDFLPARLLDIAIQCAGTLDAPRGLLEQIHCGLPFGGAEPVRWVAHSLHLMQPSDSQFDLHLDRYPISSVLDWARLFSQRIPATLNPSGSVSGDLAWSFSDLTQPGSHPHPSSARSRLHASTLPDPPSPGWSGGLIATLDEPYSFTATHPVGPAPAAAVQPLPIVLDVPPGPQPQLVLLLKPLSFELPPLPAAPPATTPDATPAPPARPQPGQLTLSGRFLPHSYTLTATGTAAPAQLDQLAAQLPPFADGLAAAFAHPPADPSTPRPLTLLCTRDWPALQVCSLSTPASSSAARSSHRHPPHPSSPPR